VWVCKTQPCVATRETSELKSVARERQTTTGRPVARPDKIYCVCGKLTLAVDSNVKASGGVFSSYHVVAAVQSTALRPSHLFFQSPIPVELYHPHIIFLVTDRSTRDESSSFARCLTVHVYDVVYIS